MMYHKIVLLFSILVPLLVSCHRAGDGSLSDPMERVAVQMDLMYENAREAGTGSGSTTGDKPGMIPLTISAAGELKLAGPSNWCSGFYPGMLWLMSDLTGDPKWKSRAREYTGMVEEMQYDPTTHDIGFIMLCSHGNGFRITGDEQYRDVLVRSAKTLATRFNSTVGCTRSWDWGKDRWQFPVIIDNMMNLELLFWATGETGDSSYYHMARTHALTTMKNHFRDDYSTFHVVDYDTITGDVIARETFQGYSDESCWARGEAWGLYGYTLTYRYTREPRFLEQAEGIAGFILNHPKLPEDMVTYWDFDAPGIPGEPRDASAAAITASALLELSTLASEGEPYRQAAFRIMESLGSADYSCAPGTRAGFILDHSVGHFRANPGVNDPLIYADYYYLEALSRMRRISRGEPVTGTGER